MINNREQKTFSYPHENSNGGLVIHFFDPSKSAEYIMSLFIILDAKNKTKYLNTLSVKIHYIVKKQIDHFLKRIKVKGLSTNTV